MIRRLMAAILLLPGAALGDGRAAFERGEGVSVMIGTRLQSAEKLRLACAGCHGVDGRGGREGGAASAPPIVWQVLSEPTARRGAYDAASFTRTLTEGVDPAGRRLQMPRFAMTPEVAASIQTHLATLEAEQRRGIEGLQIAIRLPEDADDRTAVLTALDEFNAAGGSWGRQVAPGQPWFLDLAAALADLRPRLAKAEQALATRTTAARPDLVQVPRATPDAPLLLSGPDGQIFIGPDAAAVVWARRHGLTLDAARTLMLTRAILLALRDAGPDATHADMQRRLSGLDLSAVVAAHPLPHTEPAKPDPD